MTTTLHRLAIVALALAGTVAAAAPASAEEFTCRGAVGAITVDNLIVPTGNTCTLDRTRVKGTIEVARGATLKAKRIFVIGNVQSEGATSVSLVDRSNVGGSIQVKNARAVTVNAVIVGGSIQLESNVGPIRVLGNIVDADVQLFQNRGASSVSNNRIDGNLQCKANVPAPKGSGNIVQGEKEDQCARL